jgi:hypothetical protein
MTFDECLNNIYASYLKIAPSLKGKLDREVRNPKLLVELAHKLSLIPPADKTIKITGSKGKGTTTRLVSQLLLKNRPETKVGLLISPESIEHNDRIRINNIPLSIPRFIELYTSLQPKLAACLMENKNPNAYLSPSGIFMLIGLLYFKQENVDYYVLETGRGAVSDEVGNIPSKLSLVTSIFQEHLDKLGPTLQDIASEKLGICTFSELVVLPKNLEPFLQLRNESNFQVVDTTKPLSHPVSWLSQNYNLAKASVCLFLEKTNVQDLSQIQSPSFFQFKIADFECYADGGIALECLDHSLLSTLDHPIFICSLPDDKNPLEITAFLKNYSSHIWHIPLMGNKSSLQYEMTIKHLRESILNSYDPYQKLDLNSLIRRISEQSAGKIYYFLGTQSYLRLIKKALLEQNEDNLNFL